MTQTPMTREEKKAAAEIRTIKGVFEDMMPLADSIMAYGKNEIDFSELAKTFLGYYLKKITEEADPETQVNFMMDSAIMLAMFRGLRADSFEEYVGIENRLDEILIGKLRIMSELIAPIAERFSYDRQAKRKEAEKGGVN